MNKPVQRHANIKRGTSNLYFKDESPIEYRMRGGVCFPTMVHSGGRADIQGFILMSGQDVKTKKVHIFEQRDFVVIESILDDNQVIEFPGIAPWLNKCFSRYYARHFFWNQDFELAKKYRLEIIRSQMVNPKPRFIEVPWADEQEARATIWKYIKLGMITWDVGSQLDRALEQVKTDDKDLSPAIHALTVLLAGVERYPFREQRGKL